jgi:hypothetical protein
MKTRATHKTPKTSTTPKQRGRTVNPSTAKVGTRENYANLGKRVSRPADPFKTGIKLGG